jgi:hypothetical protein
MVLLSEFVFGGSYKSEISMHTVMVPHFRCPPYIANTDRVPEFMTAIDTY